MTKIKKKKMYREYGVFPEPLTGAPIFHLALGKKKQQLNIRRFLVNI